MAGVWDLEKNKNNPSAFSGGDIVFIVQIGNSSRGEHNKYTCI
jgi:hypothetical protein